MEIKWAKHTVGIKTREEESRAGIPLTSPRQVWRLEPRKCPVKEKMSEFHARETVQGIGQIQDRLATVLGRIWYEKQETGQVEKDI